MIDEQISIAERLSRNLHARGRQVGNQNSIDRIEKLVEHFKAVNPFAPDYAVDAVWLKDVVVDFKATKGWLSFQGIHENTINILHEIFCANDKNYKTHIDKIAKSNNEWTVRVKMIEVLHELSPEYSKKVNMSAINQIRYIPAKTKLTEAIDKFEKTYLHLTEDMLIKPGNKHHVEGDSVEANSEPQHEEAGMMSFA